MTDWGRLIPWDDVRVGDGVRGKDNRVWVITARHGGEFVMEQGSRTFTHTPPAGAEVLLVQESLSRVTEADRELEEAIAIAGLYMGGEVVATEGPDGRWQVQGTGWTLPDLHSHLTIFHGLGQANRPADPTLAELEKFHLAQHDSVTPPTPHVHTDAPFRKGGRVSWK